MTTAPLDRSAAVARAKVLNKLTIGWNVVEATVALAAGVAAGSVSLVGFGLDAIVEVTAALALFWRLHQESRGGCSQSYDRRAQRLVAVSFVALGAYVAASAIGDLVEVSHPSTSWPGLAIAAASLVVMPMLARRKRVLAPILGSRAQQSEAKQTSLCAILSGVLLVGLGLNAAFGWWWADPGAALVIAALALLEAARTWRAESLADTCCS